MRIENRHERSFPASAAEVGRLLDGLAGPGDRLWPRAKWPPMTFDRPLGVGARGGHGPIRYEVVEYVPGRCVRFRFNGERGPAAGLQGHHCFEVFPKGEKACTLRHTIEGAASGATAVAWRMAFRYLHDALVEDALDNAEHAVTGSVARPARWNRWVRVLRRAMGRK